MDLFIFVSMNAPKLPSFFKTTSHRQFDFKTRYYDPTKEQRAEHTDLNKTSIAYSLISNNWANSKRSKTVNQSNKRWLLIALILTAVCIIFLSV